MPKEKPILFNTEMVKAILDGRKTQTRRVIKPQPPDFATLQMFGEIPSCFYCADKTQTKIKMPYHVGDTLWVRETWWANKENWRDADTFLHKADFPIDGHSDVSDYKWRPSRYMPRAAARLFLEVTDVRVERVQDITLRDILCEGIEAPDCRECFNQYGTPCCKNEESECGLLEGSLDEFISLWDSIYAKNGYGWLANPYVWVIEFRRIDNYA